MDVSTSDVVADGLRALSHGYVVQLGGTDRAKVTTVVTGLFFDRLSPPDLPGLARHRAVQATAAGGPVRSQGVDNVMVKTAREVTSAWQQSLFR